MSGITTCPRCHADIGPSAHVTQRGLVCPHCQAPLTGATPASLAAPQVDPDVRRPPTNPEKWRKPIAIAVLAVLIALTVLAIALVVTEMPSGVGGIGWAIGLACLFLVLDALVIGAIIVPFGWLLLRDSAQKAARVVGFLLLALGVAFAVVSTFFFVCASLLADRGLLPL